MQFFLWPGGLIVLIGFGLVYAWILHTAVKRSVYRITGLRFLDSYVLSWLFGLAAAISPILLYLAFGFKEFADTADGRKLQHQLRRAAQLGVGYLVFYAAVVLLTVPQK